jgi:DNA-binding NarL/FixJ family response regulator
MTAIELAIIREVARGREIKEIAERLQLRRSEVEQIIDGILKTLELADRVELLLFLYSSAGAALLQAALSADSSINPKADH